MTLFDWVPPALKPTLRRLTGRGLRFTEGFEDFAATAEQARGYGDSAITDRVVAATRAVLNGEAVAERDGVLLDRPEIPWFAVAGLAGATASDGTLRVVDFGGALGTVYRSAAPILPQIARWTVIEQPALLSVAAEFATETLRFAEDFDDPGLGRTDVVLFSGVLQYLPDPEDACRRAARSGARRIVIDRTPYSLGDNDRFAIQHLPRSFYAANYPSRFFARDAIGRLFPGWRVVADRVAEEGIHRTAKGAFIYRGHILEGPQE